MTKSKYFLTPSIAAVLGAVSGAGVSLNKQRLTQEWKDNIRDRMVTTPWGKGSDSEWREIWNKVNKTKAKSFIRQKLSTLEKEWGASVQDKHIDEEGLAYYCTKYAVKDLENKDLIGTVDELCTHKNKTSNF